MEGQAAVSGRAGRLKSGLAKWKNFWRDVDRPVRRVVVFLLAAGVILTLAGVVGDLSDAWPSFPFMVNMLSSVAAACFGIPVALVVLQFLLEQQEERRTRVRLERLSSAMAERLYDLAWSLIADRAAFRRIWDQLQQAQILLNRMKPNRDANQKSSDPFDWEIGPEEVIPFTAAGVDEAKDLVESAIADLDKAFVWFQERTAILHEAEVTWRYMDGDLRLRCLEVGVKWLPPKMTVNVADINWDPFEDKPRRYKDEPLSYPYSADLHTRYSEVGQRAITYYSRLQAHAALHVNVEAVCWHFTGQKGRACGTRPGRPTENAATGSPGCHRPLSHRDAGRGPVQPHGDRPNVRHTLLRTARHPAWHCRPSSFDFPWATRQARARYDP